MRGASRASYGELRDRLVVLAPDPVTAEKIGDELFAAGSLFMVFFVFLLELLVDVLQAFIFTTLISSYLADSLEYQH